MLLISCKKEVVKTKQLPNFLIVIADDAGWNDVGYHGSEIKTPVIDSLAKNGVRLERFYVAPTCSPSRASLLTGRPASRMGILAPISGKSDKALPSNTATLPQALQKRGYSTALFGKWHLGLKPESGPQAYGFEHSYGFLHGQIDQYTHKYKNGDPSWHRNGTFTQEEGHVTDLISKEFINWIQTRENPSKPFFSILAYSAPHFPLQEKESWKKPYREMIQDSSRVDFAAAMTHMDHNLGDVIQKLNEMSIGDNTLIIFISDNGAMENWYPTYQYDGHHGPNNVLGNNSPLRDWKTSNYEGGIRVPAILYWKDHLTPMTLDQNTSIIDLMPTLLSLAEEKNIPTTVEGRNIWESLQGKKSLVESPIYIRGHLQESIIKGPWKLIRTRRKDSLPKIELYNILIDPEEKNNMEVLESAKRRELLKILKSEFAKDDPKSNY